MNLRYHDRLHFNYTLRERMAAWVREAVEAFRRMLECRRNGKPVSPYPCERRREVSMRPHCATLARELGMQDLAARDK